jgi:hypothetical protein
MQGMKWFVLYQIVSGDFAGVAGGGKSRRELTAEARSAQRGNEVTKQRGKEAEKQRSNEAVKLKPLPARRRKAARGMQYAESWLREVFRGKESNAEAQTSGEAGNLKPTP